MGGEVKLNRYHRNIAVFQRPKICILSVVQVHEFSGKPIIFLALRVDPLIEFLNPICLGLPADSNSFKRFSIHLWEVHVEYNSLREAFFENICRNAANMVPQGLEIGVEIIV